MIREKGEALSLWAARRLGERILFWHQTRGLLVLKEWKSSESGAYVATLNELTSSRLNNLEVLIRLAHLQRSGKFEFAYHEQLPELSQEIDAALRQLRIKVPTTLGSAAQTVMDLLEQKPEIAKEGGREYDLPKDWESEPSELRPGRVTLGKGDTSGEVLRRYFAQLAQYEEKGLGGREVIVDLNEDVWAGDSSAGSEVFAYAPGSFYLSLVSGPDTLPTLLLTGAIAVTVILGEGAQADGNGSRATDRAGLEGPSE